MNKPLLSICIPTYNRADIVNACVEDCLKLPYDWIEIVVTDNCSSDNTIKLLSSVNDSRFKIYHNDNNIGYVNFIKCLTNGQGKFCLLLSDEDVFVHTDWADVKKQLESDEKTAVFQFRYEDENKTLLVNPPDQVYRANELASFQRVLKNFSFAGGMIIRKDILDKCWDEAIQKPLLWSLYSEIVIPLYSIRYGDYATVEGLCVRRSDRNNTGMLDTKAWCGGMDEPYWTIESRKRQNLEWIDFFAEFDVEYKIRLELAQLIVCDSITSICGYYSIVNGNLKDVLFLKYKEVIVRDKKIYKNNWIRSSHKIYKMMKKQFDLRFETYNKINYYKKTIKAFARMYVFFIKRYALACLKK